MIHRWTNSTTQVVLVYLQSSLLYVHSKSWTYKSVWEYGEKKGVGDLKLDSKELSEVVRLWCERHFCEFYKMDLYTSISLKLGLVQLNFADTKILASGNSVQCLWSWLSLSVLLAGLMFLPAQSSGWCCHTTVLYKQEVVGVHSEIQEHFINALLAHHKFFRYC